MSDVPGDDAELREALKQATARLAEARAANSRLPSLQQELASEGEQLSGLREKLAREQQDVDRLSGLSLTHLWTALTNRTEQKLSDEQKDVDVLLVEVASREQSLKQRQTTVAIAQEQAGQTPTLAKRQRELVDALAQRQVSAGGAAAARINDLVTAMTKQAEAVKQLDEVISAAKAAKSLLDKMDSSLSSASSWSTYDTWFGGGIIASSIKHNRVDEATSLIAETHSALRTLAAESNDVRDLVQVSAPEISQTLRTVDIWFDNIFTDWMVGDRIRASVEAVRKTQGEVVALYADAKSKRSQAAEEFAQREREYLQIFTG